MKYDSSAHEESLSDSVQNVVKWPTDTSNKSFLLIR